MAVAYTRRCARVGYEAEGKALAADAGRGVVAGFAERSNVSADPGMAGANGMCHAAVVTGV